MKEKRKHPRVKAVVPISYECYDDDGEIVENRMGMVLDVSLGGILMESDAIIDANHVKIVFVNYNNKECSIIGSVVHSRGSKSGKTYTGICFHGGENESNSFVANLIRTYHYRKSRSSQSVNKRSFSASIA